MAVRYVFKSVTQVLDWAAQQTDKIFDSIIKVVEDAGSAITSMIDWAASQGNAMLEKLGGAFERVGNSISYALSYISNNFLPGLGSFIKGLLDAGAAIADILVWAAVKDAHNYYKRFPGIDQPWLEIGRPVGRIIITSGQGIEKFCKCFN